MGQAGDYEALIRELLDKVAGGCTSGNVKGWLMSKRLNELELAQWLRANGEALGADEMVRRQLGCLAGLGLRDLAEVAGELVRGWEPQVDEGLDSDDDDYLLDRDNDVFTKLYQSESVPDNDDEACYNQAYKLFELDRYEEAISYFDRAIEIKPDLHEAWSKRSLSLLNLGKYPEAIVSYDRAVEIDPDDHEAWSNRGSALGTLGKYPESIVSYDRAVEIDPDDHEAWHGRGIVLVNSEKYEEAIKNYDRAFQHINRDTHPEGWGFFQHKIGRTYYKEVNNQLLNYQRSPQDYYNRAITSYKEAITTLTRKQFPNLRLETLIDTAKAYLAQKNPSAARDCQTEALTIWLELINAEASPQGKKRLYLEYNHLLRTQVDLSILDGEPIHALEIAEFDKNKHLEWFLYAQEQQGQTASLLLKQIEQLRLNVVGLQYQHMRQLLAPNRAIIYWHLSPEHLTL